MGWDDDGVSFFEWPLIRLGCQNTINKVVDQPEDFCKFINYLSRWMFSNFLLDCIYFSPVFSMALTFS
jgi:hypothetical protein